jgi:hypothetical protein
MLWETLKKEAMKRIFWAVPPGPSSRPLTLRPFGHPESAKVGFPGSGSSRGRTGSIVTYCFHFFCTYFSMPAFHRRTGNG